MCVPGGEKDRSYNIISGFLVLILGKET